MTRTLANWSSLRGVLEELYAKCGAERSFEMDAVYLGDAYRRVDELWRAVAEPAQQVRFVLLGEAPMWGAKESYIYNPAAHHTSFFYYSDAEQIVGGLSGAKEMIAGVRPRKVEMIRRLTEEGFLACDLLPFSLSKDKTAVNYRQLSGTLRRWLFKATADHYFIPRLQLIKSKLAGTARFAFRYARLSGSLHAHVKSILLDRDVLADGDDIESVHSGYNIDRERLALLFLGLANDA